MTHHSLKIQPLPNFVSIRFSKKFPKNLAQRRRVCLHFRPFWEFRPFYVAYKSCDGREPQLPKKALKIQTVLIYLDNIKLHERERERAGGRLFPYSGDMYQRFLSWCIRICFACRFCCFLFSSEKPAHGFVLAAAIQEAKVF